MSNNTYGSYGLREEHLNDPLGKKIKFDTLFNNLYDYWTLYHDLHQQILRNIVDFQFSLIAKLKINIRRRWRKNLPNINIVLERYKEADDFFNPMQFLEKFDNEKYFELLVDWKKKNEGEYLEKKPWLNRVPIRHRKLLCKSPREIIRGAIVT